MDENCLILRIQSGEILYHYLLGCIRFQSDNKVMLKLGKIVKKCFLKHYLILYLDHESDKGLIFKEA